MGGADPTRLIAALTAAFALGQIAGPLLAAHLVAPGSDFSGPLLAASVLLVAGTMGLAVRRRETPNVQPLKGRPS